MADSRRKTVLCLHFQRGTCRKGASCSFAHGESELAKRSQRSCSYFLSPSGCKQGDNCKFSHVFSDAEIQAAQAERKEIEAKGLCRYFLQGRCNKGSACVFSHDKGTDKSEEEPQTAASAGADDPSETSSESSPEPTAETAESTGAKSMVKAKVTAVDEDRALVRLMTEAGESKLVNLKSFTELWPLVPRCGDRIWFPAPPGGESSRWILPTLESMAPVDAPMDLALQFLKSMHAGYEEQGSNILMRIDMYCQPCLNQLLGIKFARDMKSVSLAKLLLQFLQSILPACRGYGSSASEPGLLLKVLRSRLWQRELPKLLGQADGGDHFSDGSVKDLAKSVANQIVQTLPRYAYLVSPVLLQMLKPADSLQQLLSAMADRLALEDGFVQCASSWRQLPLVPQILSEDLSDVQDLPEVGWMYESVSDYLDTYFRLLRADCFAPLQKGIRDFINSSLDPRDMRLFRANASQFHLVRGSKGLVASVECTNIFKHTVNFPARVLMPSNLVCLSISEAPFAEVLWGRVAERPQHDRQVQRKETMTVTIEFLDDLNRIDRSNFISCLLAPPSGGLILAESPVFFLSFGPVLRRLQGLTAGDHGTLPLRSCLLGQPSSAEEARQELPWSEFALGSLQDAIDSGERVFDESQEEALEVILTSTVSTIQGPPGTGKSFTGVEAIRHLLKVPSHFLENMVKHEDRRPSGPLFDDSDVDSTDSMLDFEGDLVPSRPRTSKMRILVLTFKNHALDEFLLDCQKHCPHASIVRIGGRSESEQLKALNLQARAKEKAKGPRTGKMLRSLIERKNELKPRIQRALDGLSEKLDPFELFWQHTSLEQKLSLLDGCPLASGNRPAFQKQRHQQQHAAIRECILFGDSVAPEGFRACFRRWCPAAVSISRRPEVKGASKGKGKDGEAEVSDEEAEEEVKERQAFQERLEKLCTWCPDGLKDVLVYSPSTAKISRRFPVGQGLSYAENLWQLDDQSRAGLLGICLQNEISASWPVIESLCQENDDLQARINELERGHLASILQDADIVGCTISGASIRCDLLADVPFPVVVVEEAAEILEPQLLAALPPSCKQLVLIGDHFQLRPKIQTFQLGRERNFDRSMIERLYATQQADYPKAALKKQNRMRDEFLCLLKPFYPQLLTNHERVKNNDALNLCRKSMYFVKMHHLSEVEAAERRSPTNPKEAQMILAFAQHILREGYQAQDISVLAMYDGQVSLLRNLLRNEGLENIQCSSVDRYQGDENSFVLISLVRSNAQGKLGFVAERNRLIVALSRARCGVYMFGNDQLLEKSKEWKLVLNALEDKDCLGPKLPLICPRHVEVRLEVGQQCHHVCNALLDCGHTCRQPCHREGHHPECDREVQVTLPCGHEKSCKCSEKEAAAEKLKCSELVEFRHDVCQHPDTRKCWDKKKRCETNVMMRCDRCGEDSQVPCWIKKDKPEHFNCSKPCTRKMSCHHACKLQCYDDCDKGLDDCELCAAEREEVKKQKLQEIKKALDELKSSDFTSIDEIQLDGSREQMEVQQQLQAYFPEAQWRVELQHCHRVKNNTLEKRFLQRHESINCPNEPKLLLVELPSVEMAQVAAHTGLAEALGTRTGKQGKGKSKLIAASHADFFLSSQLQRRDVAKHGKYVHLALCRVQCGRIYELGKPHHRRKLSDKLLEGFDSAYDDQQLCYRLSRANLQLALPLFIMEVQVKIRHSMAEMPLYWSPEVAPPFGLVPVTSVEYNALTKAVRPGGSLGGRDQREGGDYSQFRLKAAWRLEHPGLWGKYAAEKQNMAHQLQNLSQSLPSPQLRREMLEATSLLPAELDASLNEVYLTHGTKPDILLNILAGGLNERFSGGLFGNGTYLAEDVAKNDQYCTCDEKYDMHRNCKEVKDLHHHLFDVPKVKHPGNIYYVIFCRVLLGHVIRTKDGEEDMDDAELGERIQRYREFIVFHGDRIYPEYLVAYRRE